MHQPIPIILTHFFLYSRRFIARQRFRPYDEAVSRGETAPPPMIWQLLANLLPFLLAYVHFSTRCGQITYAYVRFSPSYGQIPCPCVRSFPSYGQVTYPYDRFSPRYGQIYYPYVRFFPRYCISAWELALSIRDTASPLENLQFLSERLPLPP